MDQKTKRDQRAYNLFEKYSFDLILNMIMGIVNDMNEPYTLGVCFGGKLGYAPKAMAMVTILHESMDKTCREMEAYLRHNPEIAKKIGLDSIPSKSTIQRTMKRIPEEYLDRINRKIVEKIEARDLAGDSSGLSERRLVNWLSVRTNDAKKKAGASSTS